MLCAAIDDFAHTTAERFHGGAVTPDGGRACALRARPRRAESFVIGVDFYRRSPPAGVL
jgi:hypothetical protein